ncbi:MAG: autoinducer binding domain-containing protein [Acidobacteria bacterium]|nr:autoinducer binding domain-containing protein [Acidobacteriota bacterium]
MYTHSQSRPFPSHLFIGFSKRDLQQTREIVHYCYTSQTNGDTHRALTLAQTLLPCDKIVAAAGPLSSEGLDQDQANVINISYPLPWLERYLNNRYIGIDPVASRDEESTNKLSGITRSQNRIWQPSKSLWMKHGDMGCERNYRRNDRSSIRTN